MTAIWINDIHMESLDDGQQEEFLCSLRDQDAGCVLVGGDIPPMRPQGG
jgi:hypothetical protein